MIEKFEVKLVRLKSGEDLICFCYVEYKTNQIFIKYPKSFYSTYNTEENNEELILFDWLPSNAFGFQDVTISLDNILFTTFTTMEFGFRYLKELSELLPKESDMKEKVNVVLEQFTIPNEITIH